jgi:hypothetical protein
MFFYTALFREMFNSNASSAPITALINAFVPSITSNLSHFHRVIGTAQNSLLFDPGAVNLEKVYFRRNRFTYLFKPPEVIAVTMSISAHLTAPTTPLP